ncbi:uncharacterized protein LOC120474046 [Pimephales promelas]|uniref:uncharacterized protein LOC120474046 n=1 Tax=Pimephales promelas TaxID=90988 RepID=UPI001955A176|nr:uncharacterized protein LOC120474046 [Pimephales promelas]XP_039520136.1 uncharacterized protein LOC120474046 [Pimephales promelas]
MNQPDETSMSLQKLEALNDELQGSIKKLNSDFDEKHSTLQKKIKKLKDITADLESCHSSTTMWSLIGSSAGVAGGVTALVGLGLSFFSFGIPLAVSAVGVAAGVAGGITGATANIINMVKQGNLRETIKNTITDFQNTIQPMIENLNKISETAVEIQNVGKEFSVQKKAIMTGVRSVKTASSVTKLLAILRTAQIGKTAAKKVGKVTGVISTLFLALDIYSIVCDSIELSEINQPENSRKVENIKSETLKFIHQMKETAAQLQETLDDIKSARDEINRELQIR